MLIHNAPGATASTQRPARFRTALSSTIATSNGCGAAGGSWISSAPGRYRNFSSMPSSFHATTSLPSCLRQSAIASVHPSASPSGRTWLITTKRFRSRRTSAICSKPQLVFIRLLFVRGQFDLTQEVQHAVAALGRGVELEVQAGRKLENDTARQVVLQLAARVVQLCHRLMLLLFSSNDADEDVRVLEVGRDIDFLDGHELCREAHLTSEQEPELALEEFVDPRETMFHRRLRAE